MEFFTERTLKIGKFHNFDGSIRVSHRIILGVGMRARINRDHFSNRPELGPYHGKDQQHRAQDDEPDHSQTIAPFLLKDFRTSLLAFTLPLLTHENSLMMRMILKPP